MASNGVSVVLLPLSACFGLVPAPTNLRQVLSRYVRGISLRTGRVFDWEAPMKCDRTEGRRTADFHIFCSVHGTCLSTRDLQHQCSLQQRRPIPEELDVASQTRCVRRCCNLAAFLWSKSLHSSDTERPGLTRQRQGLRRCSVCEVSL